MLSPTASSGLEDSEAREHYQRRLGTCFGALAAILAAFALFAVVVVVALVPSPGTILLTSHALAGYARVPLLLLGRWVCRGRVLGVMALGVIEVAVSAAAMALTATPLLLNRTDLRADLSAVALFMLLLSLRAGLLPASPRRALAMSLATAAPLVAIAARRFSDEMPGNPVVGVSILVSTIILCLSGVAAAWIVSRTILGLRTEVETVRKLGQYTLEDKIGQGGMGAVYRARHALLRRPAAIKLLRADRTTETDLARFEREVQLTSQLTHPNTVSIFDYGRTAQGGFYYVMEYLDGFDLDRLVKDNGPLPPARVIRILTQASSALHEAHLMGLVHRDIKPANIILTERADEPDVVKVVDFGLVRAQSQDATDVDVTGTTALIGTPSYLAPEAILSGSSVDPRSDLYALGAVGYFLLTGKPVFRGASLVELCQKHLLEAPTPPSRRGSQPVPADLEAVILACLAKEPAERPASAAALRDALLACADAAHHDEADARRWWREHRTRARESGSMPVAQTVSIPIELRVRREGEGDAR